MLQMKLASGKEAEISDNTSLVSLASTGDEISAMVTIKHNGKVLLTDEYYRSTTVEELINDAKASKGLTDKFNYFNLM